MTFINHVPGAVLTEREHRVPLDHARPDGPSITVFTREVAATDGTDRPYLVFLQGGPGYEAARPTSPPSGWMKRALTEYRVLLLDQRGTGRSTPVGPDLPRPRPGSSGTSGPTRSSGMPSGSAGSWAWIAGACWARASAASRH